MAAKFIIEADGGSRGNPGPAAYGTVVRRADTGEVLVEKAGYLGETTNNVAEYTGLLEGLALAFELDADAEVEARLDSKLVVEQMSGRWKIKNDALRKLAIEGQGIARGKSVTYTWVPREQNKAADALVNELLDSRGSGSDELEILRRF
ncbi:MAG: reverse transcriptase-like protein [Candidatus Nanopelagicales bacterium]